MIRVVIDTNVLVSANIKTAGAEARALDLVATRRLQPSLRRTTIEGLLATKKRPGRRLLT
jgi:predicted nucleic acid-binding protein